MSRTASPEGPGIPEVAPLLEVADLTVWFRQYDRGLRRRTVQVVQSMDVGVAGGEVVALVGASGAGKSLLAHAVLGMLPPNAGQGGTITWCGQEMSAGQRAALAGSQIALLPQSLTALDPTATVRSQVKRSAVLRGLAPEAGLAALGALGLEQRVGRRFPHQLSGGMGRRVLAAMALLGDPKVVIADEPTPGLPPATVAEVLNQLRVLADEGRGVLLITHDLEAAVAVADRVVVCDRGRTVDAFEVADFSGDPAELQHEYTRTLWLALPSQGFRLMAQEASC